jgi:glutamyl-tRNA synthetase/glutamyl-Q tRNA(Asp) synthetase
MVSDHRPARFSLTRFAPAPTGWLHLGHALNAAYVWQTARETGARVLLRIEDHDRERCRPEYEAGILEDLEWLGFEPDVFTPASFRSGRCAGRQRDRGAIYEAAARTLAARGRLYACDCSRRTLAGQAGEPAVYPGTCRDRGLALDAPGSGWRVRLDADVEAFLDLRLGPQRQRPSAQCGDVLIRDRRGNWTYQFAVTVDDDEQGIDLVVRGTDLLDSTGRQIQLARLLGRAAPPSFLHHPLVMKGPGQKLSKSDGDTGVRALRAAGWTPAQVIEAARNLAREAG